MHWALDYNTHHPLRRRLAYNLPWLPSLHDAASRGSDRVLSFILELGKKLPFPLSDVLGHSLTVASDGGHVAAVRVLLHHAAVEHHQQRRNGTEGTGAESIRRSIAISFGGAMDRERRAIARELAASDIFDKETFDLVVWSRHGNLRSSGLPCIVRTAYMGWADVLELLISKGVDFEAHDLYGISALSIAAFQSELECVEVLLQAGANPISNARFGSRIPLGIVAMSKQTETKLLSMLLAAAKAVDPNFAVRGGLLTIPDRCFLKEHKKLLMEDALEFALLTTSPILRAWVLALAIRQGDLQGVEVLMKSGANAKLQIGRCTAVEHAIENDQIAIVGIIVAHCPEALTQGTDGTTALQFAAIHNKVAICELLPKQYRADVNCPSANERQTTALHEAVRMNHPLIALFLLQRGANVHAKEQGGYTPLHVCAMFSDDSMATLLVEHGADVRDVTDEKLTALQVAQRCGNASLMRPAPLDVLSPKSSWSYSW